MFKQKIIPVMMLGFLWITSSFAGKEDWNGTYTFKDDTGHVNTATHAPNYVQFLFIRAGACVHLNKGSSFNGMKIKENVDLCTNSNVETFTDEIQKLGLITNKTITLGPTYSN